MTASPAAAVDLTLLGEETKELSSKSEGMVVRAAAATCLLYLDDRKSAMSVFDNSGWEISGDGEWVEINRNDIWVTLLGSNEDFFCDVASNLTQAEGAKAMANMFQSTNWDGWISETDAHGCRSLRHPFGFGMAISSGGNDPVCTPTPHSSISISFTQQ
jgi:hypothetical protein